MTLVSHDLGKAASNGSQSKKPWFLVGASPAISRLRELVPTLAKAKVPILLLGETGVGKTALVSLLHGDRSGPLVSVNCASLTDTVATSELFGNVRGAFTGALGADGLLHAAHEGTLFLDEVASLSPSVQAMLLTPLDDGHYRRVGAGSLSYSSARFLCATNSDPDSLVRDGRFREDLLFRLAKIRLTIPPLRERMEDVPLLIDYALDGTSTTIDPLAKGRLIEASREFKGNVRQLLGVIEVACVFASSAGAVIDLDNPALSDSFLQGASLDLTPRIASKPIPSASTVLVSAVGVPTPAPTPRASAPLKSPLSISPEDLCAAVDSLNPYTELGFSGRGLSASSYENLASKIPGSSADNLKNCVVALRPLISAARKKFLSDAIARGASSHELCTLTALSTSALYGELSKYSLTLKKSASVVVRSAPVQNGPTLASVVSFIEGLGNAVVSYVEDDEIRSFFAQSTSPFAIAAISNEWDFLTPFRKRQSDVMRRVFGFQTDLESTATHLKIPIDRLTRVCEILGIPLPTKKAIEVPSDSFDRITAHVENLENPFSLSLKSDRSGTALDLDSAKKLAAILSLDVEVIIECSRLNSDALQKQITRRRAGFVCALHEKGVDAKAAMAQYSIAEGMLKRTLTSLGIAFGVMGTKTFTPQTVCNGDSLADSVLELLGEKVNSNPFEVPILSRNAGEPALRFIAREYLKNEALHCALAPFDRVIFDLIRAARIRLVNSETATGKPLDQVARDLKQTKYSLEQLLDLI